MGFLDKIKQNLEIKPLLMEAVCVALIVFYGGIGWAYEAYATFQRTYPTATSTPAAPVKSYIPLQFISINSSMVSNGCINFLLMSVLTWIAAPISGGHLNPAITVGYILTKNIELIKGLLYIAAQLAGSIAGAFLYGFATPGFIKEVAEYANVITGLPKQHESFGYQSLVIQILGSFCLMFVFYALRIEKRAGNNSSFGVAIGALTAASVMCFGEFTYHKPGTKVTDKLHGVSVQSNMNPARVFGPMLLNLFSFKFKHLLYAFIGPVIGAATLSLIYKWFLHKKESEEEDEENMMEME